MHIMGVPRCEAHGLRIVVCGLPIFFYLLTRLARLCRYYLNRRSTRILRAVIRPGADDQVQGALVQLELSRPRPWIETASRGRFEQVFQ